MKSSLSLQLYSLRREMTVDPESTLRRVPSLGYDGVELAGTYGWSAEKWKRLLEETGLKVVGAHAGLQSVETEWASEIEFQRFIGNNRLIVSSLPSEVRTPQGFRLAAQQLNAL